MKKVHLDGWKYEMCYELEGFSRILAILTKQNCCDNLADFEESMSGSVIMSMSCMHTTGFMTNVLLCKKNPDVKLKQTCLLKIQFTKQVLSLLASQPRLIFYYL